MLAQHASTWEIYNPPQTPRPRRGTSGKGKGPADVIAGAPLQPTGQNAQSYAATWYSRKSPRFSLFACSWRGKRQRRWLCPGALSSPPSSQRRHRPSGRMVVPLSRVLIHARKRAERAPCPRTYQRRGIKIVSQTSHPKLQVHILPPLFPSITEKAPPGLSNGPRSHPRAGGEVKFGTASLHCYRSMPNVSSKETSGRRHDTPVEVFHLSVRRVSPQLAYFLR